MNTYVPLHVHSHYSLLDGLSKPTHIAKRCVNNNINACAITDHGNLFGAVTFMSAMKKRGLKPIIGCEMYICPNDPTIKDGNRDYSHIVVLAKNKQGWQQLIKAVSAANDPKHFYYKPRLSLAKLAEYADGNLIAFSGHLGSDLSRCVFSDISSAYNCETEEQAKAYTDPDWANRTIKTAKYLEEIFGKGNFYIENQLVDVVNMPAASLLSKGLRYVSKKTGIPIIATPDAHYSDQEDAVDQRILLCSALGIQMPNMNTTVNRGSIAMSAFFRSRNYHIPTYEELIVAGNTEEELANTITIGDMCEEYSITGPAILPRFDCPDGLTADAYLHKLCEKGWEQRLSKIQNVIQNSTHTEQEYKDRLAYEMKVLTDVGLSDYFLIVNDIIEYAKSSGQLTGAGRGSAAGSLVLYLLGVSHVDPIEYDLLFSRFYNAGRNTKEHRALPDVDMDFERNSREGIISYIRSKFGHNKVAQMITLARLQGCGAIKEVLRARGACSFDEMNRITEFIPDEAEISDQLQDMREADKKAGGDGEASIIEWALEHNAAQLKEWAYYDDNGNIQGPMGKYFEQAIRIEGTKKSQSKHASGIIISQYNLSDVCPMVYDSSNDEMICGMEMNDLEAMGHTKFDILGVNSLDKIHGVLNLLRTGRL